MFRQIQEEQNLKIIKDLSKNIQFFFNCPISIKFIIIELLLKHQLNGFKYLKLF